MTIDTISDRFDSARGATEPAIAPVRLGTSLDATVHWLAAVSTGRAELDDPHGWYRQALNADTAVSGANVLALAISSFSPDELQETRTFTRHTLERTAGRVRPFELPADSYSWSTPSWSMLVKANGHVVAHAGIVYRVIQVGNLRVPVGGVGGLMTLNDWRGRGYARAVLAKATAFVAKQLWAPFAVVICPMEDTAFYEHLGWDVAEVPIQCEQPNGRVTLEREVALSLACQGDAQWPSGSIDLRGTPW
jgi:GNAT superfamily N-acetyltransferase